MSKHHRFTGRELSTLLEQVRDELGSEATILEANKIRTGGVAGFFKTEQYEVVAAPGGSSIELDDEGGTRAVHLDLIEPDGSASAGIVIGEPPHAVDRIDLSTAIDEVRAERFRDVPDTLDIRTPLPSSLPPQDRPRPDDFSTDRQEPALPALSPGNTGNG